MDFTDFAPLDGLEPKKKKQGDNKPQYKTFLRGPIPLDWLRDAKALGPSEFYVGISLWYFSGMNGKLTFKAGIEKLTLNSVCPATVKRGLLGLEKKRLIKIERKAGCKNLFTILEAQYRIPTNKKQEEADE